ncbi:MAG: tetratricopeptide repeat protein [Bradymonadales bacterium]
MKRCMKYSVTALVFATLLGGVSLGCASSKKEETAVAKEAEQDYEMAVNFFNHGETAQAIRSLSLVLANDPEHAKAHHLMGFLRMGRRQYPEAIAHFKRALESEPQMLTCKNNLGVAYMYMEQYEEAALIFKELCKSPLYTSPWLAYANLGWAYYKLGLVDDGIQETEMALFLNPKMCLASNNLGLMYASLKRDSDAQKYLQEAIAGCANYAEPHLHLGLIMANRGDYGAAAAHFNRCSELSPKSDLGQRCRSNIEAIR